MIAVSAEDVFDTISEARTIAPVLDDLGYRRLAIVTSKYHTRRAGHIWRYRLSRSSRVHSIAARRDPFDPEAWWRSGQQIRWLLAEYGGWLFYYWTRWYGDAG